MRFLSELFDLVLNCLKVEGKQSSKYIGLLLFPRLVFLTLNLCWSSTVFFFLKKKENSSFYLLQLLTPACLLNWGLVHLGKAGCQMSKCISLLYLASVQNSLYMQYSMKCTFFWVKVLMLLLLK